MTIEITKELLKVLHRHNLNLNTWVFLLSLQSGEDLYDLEDAHDYAFVAQHLGVLGLIKLCDDETENLYCLTDAGFQTINKIHEDTKQGIQDSD